MAAIAHLYVDQGATFNSTITVYDENGDPMDLTGYVVRSQMRRSYVSNNFVNFTVVISDAANGLISLSLDKDATASLKHGRYVYDVEVEDGGSVVTRVIEGTVFINPEVTK